jgi:NAD(P)-dependent dehydrogenase (short-subunit alcohol dehydrogenase family)
MIFSKKDPYNPTKKLYRMNLTNKVALITGGTHGIGAETAIELAKHGVRLCLAARNIDAVPIRQQIEECGGECLLVAADLSREDQCKMVVKKTLAHFGRLDILVHSAGSAAPGSLLTCSADTWYGAFDIHLHAAFHLCAAAVPFMKEQNEGAIILISSAAGLRGVKNALPYAVVKGAIPQFTRAMALELSDYNIRVNCVSPGIIRTRFQDYLTHEQVSNNLQNRIPLHREGTTEDVAQVIHMLVSNDFITGENVVIDGGMTMRIV